METLLLPQETVIFPYMVKLKTPETEDWKDQKAELAS